jgi:endoglucanase
MKIALSFILILLGTFGLSAQGLTTQGKAIVNASGDEVLLRGVGPGGWQIMEGYMMQSSDVAGSQHEIKEKLIELMGEEKTETFFTKWRMNHFTQRDVDSLAAWGFNSIRLPMHYNLFTLPIEEEPVPGENTWKETGFELIDNLLEWTAPHNMYVILDMHATPGGQGTGSEINDYDPDKPSLWESQANKDKLVALWTRIAERYKDNEWIGGYDLINEPHWNLPGGTDLRNLYVDITAGIRSVDTEHIIYIEGNWYANDFTGLTPPWDDNIVYSFHKYWSFNDEVQPSALAIRDQYNVPLWMGESGENSNTWFTDAVSLFEDNNIGWAWWTMRKIGDIDSPYAVDINPGYQAILDYWRGNGPKPTEQEAFDGMMQLAENLLVPNSKYRKDVPDALIRQVQTDETIPYSHHEIPGLIHFSDYDLGKNEFAYFDQDVADYNLSTGNFQAWNAGWSYRNDGVDIEVNSDNVNSNGYHVGFTEKGEWMSYTVQITQTGVYQASMRLASGLSDSRLHFSLNDQSITSSQAIQNTGGWNSFTTYVIDDILLEAGEHVLRLHFDEGSVNVSSVDFTLSGTDEPDFGALTGKARSDEKSIDLIVNKPILASSLTNSENLFSVTVNGASRAITNITNVLDNDREIIIDLESPLHASDQIKLSYNGAVVLSNTNEPLADFSDLYVSNTLEERIILPGKVEAEDYDEQSGLGLEETTDIGGGLNIGYTDTGDYADYKIFVRNEGSFDVILRIAAQDRTGRVGFYLVDEESNETELETIDTPQTGGWQIWSLASGNFNLPAGIHTLRMKVLVPGFNMNWFDVNEVVLGLDDDIIEGSFLYPNPSKGIIHVTSNEFTRFQVLSLSGSTIRNGQISENGIIELNNLESGLYLVKITNTMTGKSSQSRIIIDN